MPVQLPAETVQALHRELTSADRVLITGPREVDGDSIGSSIALATVIRRFSPAQVVVAGEPGWRYLQLPGAAGNLANHQVQGPFDLVIVVDGDRRRLDQPIAALFGAARCKVVIDHHESTSTTGYDIALLCNSAASTCEIVIGLIQAWGQTIDLDTARLLYTGIAYDTGGFRHSNTSADTLRLAAQLVDLGVDHSDVVVRTTGERRRQGVQLVAHVLGALDFRASGRLVVGQVRRAFMESIGADMADIDIIVDQMLYVVGVEVAILAVERRGPQGPELKLSLRSRGGADVCAIAASLHPGGGGHRRAAGVVLPGDPDAIIRDQVIPAVIGHLAGSGAS